MIDTYYFGRNKYTEDTTIKNIRFTQNKVAGSISVGDVFEEDLLSGATVVKRVTKVFSDGSFDSEWVEMLRAYPEGTTFYQRPGKRRHGRPPKKGH